jgi:hypothetical protein
MTVSSRQSSWARQPSRCILAAAATLAIFAAPTATLRAAEPVDLLTAPPSWEAPQPAQVQAKVLAWLEEQLGLKSSAPEKPGKAPGDDKPSADDPEAKAEKAGEAVAREEKADDQEPSEGETAGKPADRKPPKPQSAEAKAIRAEAERLWADLPPEAEPSAVLDRLALTVALVDPRAERLVEVCSAPRTALVLPEAEWLASAELAPLVSANLRLYYGRWLVHHRLYDEALAQVEPLRAAEVVDPASLLFYKAIAHHRLLHREASLEAIERLLQGAPLSPQRYVVLAELIRGDLEKLEEESLDHIARRMEDIERRLDLGRANKRVRDIEDGVIESLDKLIKKVEEQQQAAAASSANSIQSSRPAQDSRIMGGKGPGRVTKRDIGSESGWGNLPPKQREEAMQQINRQFPSHYRDVIEQYFRKLAREGADAEP